MKKIILSLFMIMALVTLTGCGNSKEVDTTPTNDSTIESNDTIEENEQEEVIEQVDETKLTCTQNLNDAYNFDPYILDYEILFEWDPTWRIANLTQSYILSSKSGVIDSETSNAFKSKFKGVIDDKKKTIRSTSGLDLSALYDMGLEDSMSRDDVIKYIEGYTCK